MKKTVALIGLVAILGTSTFGCMGRMALAGKVGKFNMGVAETKWPRWLVFLCLYIIPVYPFAGAIDLLIINSIEFHTGENPISGQSALTWASHRVEGENGEFAVSTRRPDGSIDLEITDATGEEHFLNLMEKDGWYVARDGEGNPLARINEAGNIEQLGL